jgi:ATP-dependent helicase/nuclease subunit B
MLNEGMAGASGGNRLIFRSPAAFARVRRAQEFLLARGRGAEVVIVGASGDSAAQLARMASAEAGGSFGWHRFTLARLAGALASHTLGARGVTPAGPLALEAICARIVHRLGEAGLGRFAVIADRPGLPRALARTLDELRLGAVAPDELADADTASVLAAYEGELARVNVADRAAVLRTALEVVAANGRRDLVGKPLVLLDVAVRSELEGKLVGALVERAADALVTVPLGDDRSANVPSAMLVDDERVLSTALARLQAGLFSPDAVPGSADDDVVILSAPGESRECVEIARLLQQEAERGTPLDRMAILLRSPLQYRAHLEEALRRASIPAHFARGTVRPDPAGRAFLALLACAAERLSARRFAEYLSLGEVADAEETGEPPPAAPASERRIPPDEETVSEAMLRAAPEEDPDDDDAPAPPLPAGPAGPTVEGTLRAPRLWERLLVDAAVIGGRERWEKRLAGLRHELEKDLTEILPHDEAHAARIARDIEALDRLRAYALPLLSELMALAPPYAADWNEWLDKLTALATRALRRPERVLAVLAELAPMSDVGPVDLREVRLVLERRLTDLVVRPRERPFGRVYVASVEEARGLAFEVVLVPGLAERLFPQKVTEDPILPDRERTKLGAKLPTNADRSATERLMLRIAVGAAKKRLVLCYPRIDIEQSRPRTPSFYGLEVLRAAEGKLPGFDELARRAEIVGGARLGWPAPSRPGLAIDAAEHDLALLQSILERPANETVGMARYLLETNVHLARALRFRGRRWNVKAWTRADGLVDLDPLAKPALAAHRLAARSFSPTALQHYASCPYKFVLNAIHKLSPREEPDVLEELDPLQRGSLIHEVQFGLLGELREAGLVPVTAERLDRARAVLDRVLDEVAARYKDALAPAIDRVWEDGIASIRADLREVLRRSTEETTWVPAHFELSFGLVERRDRDPKSVNEPVALDCGIKLRGSIDLVERRGDGALRATDYKTGKARAVDGTIIGGGEVLQPVFYALTLEKLFPGERVDSGRLYYSTSNGDFKNVVMPLDDEARRAADDVAKTIGQALEEGFLPAAPAERGCEWCDYKPVCGPYEEQRVKKKRQDKLQPLLQLRKRS